MRDQALAGAEFAKSFQAMSESILASANPADLSAIQMNLERSMAVAEQLEDRLEDFQSSLDDMLSEVGAEDKAEYKEILAMIQREAEQEPETALDGEIEATMKQIEAMLGRQA
jgi:F0F1-type ATP synthase membrane subunit b/b'